ncbi:hypothetical protein TRFO_01940 [Tritrichomonas foetus]|uniref:Uncharacterized protein n=1 Tax=Tritrichomonas foetus TaxID=1144522 RepID=A0A1J4JKD1_9EUKA|nr:hypothetical protein TRFO_01940 [Tritrichomonas foetus]|eukprot:OHS98855.1 hypothetical protein TRFO_01940 [Tritrichomonas foetus]
MTVPQIFTDFAKNIPVSVEALAATDEEVSKRETPEYQNARRHLIDQIFSKETLSKTIIEKTNFVVLLRNLPEVNGSRDAHNFAWFAGHYRWDDLVSKTLDIQISNESGVPYAIYLVPTIGQSDQLSIRHELTYNAFISPAGQVPFNHLVRRHQREPEENVDEELFSKSDICTFPTLESLNLNWEKLMDFTNEHFEIEQPIEVYILKPTQSFITSFKRNYESSPDTLEEWYATVVLNFLPLIPYPAPNGQFSKLPLVLIDPIETTPPCYNRLISLVDKINDQFSTRLFNERIRAIKGVIKYWQFDPNSISEELVLFANNNNSIPERSPEFNKLFFDHLSTTKYFIIDEIFGNYMKIKRSSDDYEMYKDAPAEIEEEIEAYDNKVNFMLTHVQESVRNEFLPIFQQLKQEAEFWFDRKNLAQIYGEFKVAITKAMTEMLQTPSMLEYIQISKQENEKRPKWLEQYYDISGTPLVYCMWPTIYQNNAGVLHQGDKDPVLVSVEECILKNVSTNSTLPEVRGKPIPPKTI